MPQRPSESIYFSEPHPGNRVAVLNLPDTEAYLERIGLPKQLATEEPSLDLLSRILLAHHLAVPFSSVSIHCSPEDWRGPNKPIELRRGRGMEIAKGGKGNFERVVKRHGGGFCYSLNPLASALLRGYGYRVSEVSGRVYLHRGKNPTEVGVWWSPATHIALIVDWEGSAERYLFDVGFGGGASPVPMPMRDGATTGSLSSSESFKLKREKLIAGDLPTLLDPPEGWLLYRRVVPAGYRIEDPAKADEGEGYWTPCFHLAGTTTPSDQLVAEFWSSNAPDAPWVNAFVASRLLENGGRRTLSHGIPAIEQGAPQDGRKWAKLYSKDGIKGAPYDEEWVPFETGPIRAVLERDFGFRFD
ncbi:hypothetical protein JCM10213_003850 [Rhodosporidiobolus nylandii]